MAPAYPTHNNYPIMDKTLDQPSLFEALIGQDRRKPLTNQVIRDFFDPTPIACELAPLERQMRC